LTIGWAPDCGCVQHAAGNGEPPYLMAVTSRSLEDGYLEFLAGGQPSEVSRRYCLPRKTVEQIAVEFLTHGTRSAACDWEEI
jgi:hypothetical protein